MSISSFSFLSSLGVGGEGLSFINPIINLGVTSVIAGDSVCHLTWNFSKLESWYGYNIGHIQNSYDIIG